MFALPPPPPEAPPPGGPVDGGIVIALGFGLIFSLAIWAALIVAWLVLGWWLLPIAAFAPLPLLSRLRRGRG